AESTKASSSPSSSTSGILPPTSTLCSGTSTATNRTAMGSSGLAAPGRRADQQLTRRSRMRRPSGRLIGIVALVVAWCPLAVGPAVAGSIKGAVLHAGPPPEEKTVTINIDRLLHNLHSVSTENATFNRTQPKGRTVPVAFKKPEIVRIDCDLHTWMRAWVVVAEHPFFAVTGANGEFALDNVPPGKYTLKIWHETLGTVTRDVTVDDKSVTGVVVEIGK